MTRRRLLIALSILMFFSLPLYGRSKIDGFCESGNTIIRTSGQMSSNVAQGSFPGCTVTVYYAGTFTLATIYSDNNGTPLGNPFTLAPTVSNWSFYGDNNSYDVGFSGTVVVPYTRGSLATIDPSTSPILASDTYYFSRGLSLAQACTGASATGNALSLSHKWTALATATYTCPLVVNGGMIQPAAAQTITVTVQSAPDAPICDFSLGGSCVIYGPHNTVIPQWWGAVSDSITDNGPALLASINAAIAAHQNWYLPPPNGTVGTSSTYQTCYLVANPVVVTGSLAMLGAALSQGQSGTQTGTLCEPDPTKDILQIYGANGGMSVRNISFLHLAGFATGISAAAATTITLMNPSSVYLATIPAPALTYLLTVFNFQTYSNASKVYRVTAGAAGAGTQIPASGSGGVLPTGTGTETHNGITYVYQGAGTTYQQGQVAAAAQWWYHGYNSGTGTLTDVTPSQGGTGTPNNFDGMGSSVVGLTPAFSSLAYAGNTGSNQAAYIHVFTGSTFPIENNYFLQVPANSVLLEASTGNALLRYNVMDTGYNGFSGQLLEAQITGNEFFGPTGCAITSSSAVDVLVTGNQFVFGNGICLSTAYVPGVDPDSAVSSWNVSGNTFNNTTFDLQASGVTAISWTGNTETRNEIGPVLSLGNIDRSMVSGNLFTGSGEASVSTNTAMLKFTGAIVGNRFCGNDFQVVNTVQSVTTIYDWSSVPTQESLNTFCPDNTYSSFYTITTGTSVNENQPVINGTTGVFTPALQFGGASTGITYVANAQNGSYVVNGNQVTIRAVLALTSKGSATGAATIAGLPFTASSLVPAGSRFACSFSTLNDTAVGVPMAGINTGHAFIDLSKFNGSNSTAMLNTDFNNDSEMEIGCTYSQQ